MVKYNLKWMTVHNILHCAKTKCRSGRFSVIQWLIEAPLAEITYSLSLDLQLCLGSLTCCMTRFQPGFNWETGGLTFDTRILWYIEEIIVNLVTAGCPGPVAAKQAQIISPPPPCLTVGMRCLCQYAAFGFLHQPAVRYDQTFTLWSCLYKVHCSDAPSQT